MVKKKSTFRSSKVIICLFVASLFWNSAAVAEGAASSPEALVKDLLEVSGVAKMAEQIPTYIRIGIQEAQSQKKSMAEPDFAHFERLAVETFSSTAMQQGVLTGIQHRLDEASVKKLLEWHQSPIVKKMISLETEATRPEKLKEIQTFVQAFSQTPPSEKRMALLKRLDIAIKGTETNVGVVVRTQFGMMRALNNLMPPEERQSEAALKMAEEKALLEMKENMSSATQGGWAFVYRTVSDADLEEYVSYYEKEPGKNWALLVNQVLTEIMASASIELGKKVAQNRDPAK